MKHLLPLFTCLFFCVFSMDAQPLFSTWEWSHPKPQGNRLNDISMLDANTGFAVGERGAVLKTEDAGFTWELIQDIGTQADFMAVAIVDSFNLWVAGQDGLIFHSADLGQNWTAQATPIGADMIWSLFFHDNQLGWASGSSGVTLRTQDGGNTWEELGTSALLGNQLRSIFFVDELHGHVVGGAGKYLYTDDGGDTWVERNNTGVMTALNSVAFSSPLVGYVGGSSQVIRKTNDGGLTWTNTTPGTISDVWDIFMLDDNIIWFATGNGIYYTFDGMDTPLTKLTGTPSRVYRSAYVVEPNTGIAVGSNGVVARSNNPASFWVNIGDLETTASLNSIKMVAGTEVGFASGNSRWVLKTTDAGDSWTGQQVGTNNNWLDHGFSSVSVGILAGFSTTPGNAGQLFRTLNGGATWTDITTSLPGDPALRLFGVHTEVGSTTYYVCGDGGNIYFSGDEGVTWFPSIYPLNQATEDLNAITFASSSTRGYAVGNNGEIVSTSNGIVWAKQSSGSTEELVDVFALNSTTAWVVGDAGTILKTTNAGTTWTPQSLPGGSTIDLLGVVFLDLNTGWTTGLNASIFFTEDGGDTWVQQPNPAPGFLRSFSILDADNIFVCGANGVILKTTMQGIPFPVELVSFRAKRAGAECNLFWETANEVGNDGFEVQRSQDGLNWDALGWVEAQGDVDRAAHYTWTDRQPAQGINYYRLRQVDYDGTESYSEVVTVMMDATHGVFSVFPNPASGEVQLSIDQDTEILLSNSNGIILRKYSFPAGQHQLLLDDLPSGLYFLVDVRGSRTLRLMIR